MNYATFQANIKAHINRSDKDADIPVWIALACAKLEWECFAFQRYTVAISNLGTHAVLPTDFIKEVAINAVMDLSGNVLTKTSTGDMLLKQVNVITDDPSYYSLDGLQANFWPFVATPTNLNLTYYRMFPTLNDTNPWIAKVWPMTFEATLIEAWDSMGNDKDLQKAVAKLKSAKNKWRSVEMQNATLNRVAYHEF